MTDIKTITELFIPKYANFQECEIILRDHYNIPDNNEIGFFRINLDSSNDDRETVLYRAYWNKNNLDLSLCIIPTTIVTTLPETTIITTLPETTIITTMIQTTIATTLPASTIITSMPLTTIITSTPLTTIVTTLPESTTITTMPQTTIISTFAESKIITTIPEATQITSIPETTIITLIITMPLTTVITTMPLTKVFSTMLETTIITTTQESTVITTIPYTKTITTIPKIKTTEFSVETALLEIKTTQPLIETTLPMIKTTTPLITEYIGHCLDKDKYIFYDKTKDIYFHICPSYSINEINENINEIIDKIDVNKNYKIQGQDYIAQVSPIDYLNPKLKTEIFAPLTYVNFTECEIILRAHNNIYSPRKLTLIEIQTNNTIDDILVNEIDYKVYNDEKKILNLSLCREQQIKIYGTVKENLTEKLDLINVFKAKGIDILNLSDPFFNDECIPYSDGDSDLTLNNRIEEIYKNFTFCEKNCEIDKINFDNKIIECNCTIKSNFTVEDLNFDLVQKKLVKKNSNFKILKCYDNIASLKDNLFNLGFWIFLALFILNIMLLICLCCIGLKPMEAYMNKEIADYGYIGKIDRGHAFCHNYIKKLDKLILRINEMKKNFHKNNSNSNSNSNEIESNAPPKHKTHIINTTKSESTTNLKNLKKGMQSKTSKIKSDKDISKKIEKVKNKMAKTKKLEIIKYSKIPLNITSKDSIIDKKIKTKKINNPKAENGNLDKTNEGKNKNEFDLNIININLNDIKNRVFIPNESKHILNIYDFNEALLYEKRLIFQIYYIFLISKQIIMHTIFYRSPIEPLPLRISLLLSIFQFDLALNAIFYTDNKVSERHRSAKNIIVFALTNNITVIILSIVIGYIFLVFFSNLNNVVNEIRQVFRKEEKKIKDDKKYVVDLVRRKNIILEIKNILKKFKIKVVIFYVIQFILLIFYWYYSTMFCLVYNKSQISWIFDVFVTILVRIIFDLVTNLVFTLLYKLSIISKINCLYRILIFLYCFS